VTPTTASDTSPLLAAAASQPSGANYHSLPDATPHGYRASCHRRLAGVVEETLLSKDVAVINRCHYIK